MTSQLVGSDFTGATQLPNYVNGRLLTAADLATSQTTLRTCDMRLGQAAGHGVVTGLWVTSAATTLTVVPGLGVAPSGAAVSVGSSVTLPLAFPPPTAGTTAGGSFTCCTPTQATGGSAIGTGCYLLTVLPACQLTGQAALASPPDSTMPSGCTAQWQVQGAQFKVINLPLGDAVLGIPVTDDNRRNLLAHWCFGTPQLANLGEDLFGFAPGYGGFDTLDPSDLTTNDVPLAVFYWDGQAVGFVDNWSARRRITGPDLVTASWSGVTSDRRTADGQARFLQFQDQATDLVASGAANTVVAADTFPLLPPAGFLPYGPEWGSKALSQFVALADKTTAGEPVGLSAADSGAALRGSAVLSREQIEAIRVTLAALPPEPAFDPQLFFGTAARYGWLLDWEVADLALRQSWENAPVAAYLPPPDDEAPLEYYQVLQNLLAQQGGSGPGLYVVFIKKYTWVRQAAQPISFLG
jgi:hypothetical protein